MEISFKQTIFSLDSKNKKCNDCGDEDVKFVSINNGITLCELCAEIHKNLGNQISYLRSIDDEFDDYLMNFFIYGGNKKFRRTLRQMGVNLDVKKGNLYRTFGVDFYRRNLKSIVKGNSHLEKDFENPNEVMQIDSNAFPEFENYTINNYNSNLDNLNNLNILNNIQIDLGQNSNYSGGVLNNPLNDPNNNDKIKISQENKIESIKNEPDNQNQSEQGENKEGNNDNGINMKKVMDYSIKNMKIFGNFMKKEGIKGFGIVKKYSESLAQKSKPAINNVTNYVKNHVPYFNKNKNNEGENNENNNKEEDKKEEDKNEEEKKE